MKTVHSNHAALPKQHSAILPVLDTFAKIPFNFIKPDTCQISCCCLNILLPLGHKQDVPFIIKNPARKIRQSPEPDIIRTFEMTASKGKRGTGIHHCAVRHNVCEPESIHGLDKTGLNQLWTFLTVSYTHLRAHETRHDLVCRLLL